MNHLNIIEIKSQRGKPFILDYCYVPSLRCINGIIYTWRCADRKCLGRIYIIEKDSVQQEPSHNYDTKNLKKIKPFYGI